MNKLFKFAAASAVGVAVAASASSAFATDETGNASAQIQQAISIVENTPMDFGNVAVDGSGGTVTISTAGAVTGPAGYSFSGSPAAGNFTASGDASTAVTISFTAGTLTGPGTAMTINNFTNDAGGTPTTDGAGDLAFNVGADLVVNAAQASGAYAGTYTVTVNY
ncbi:DUF4402 domain-containing protein [Denitrobaculum tricleocarpae]|uniref:DUF4402 domain-containing protein n=1 Tax=Denitrobaculum tricleocarpae TaxID=2591009 RepID=A0A545TB12_9PROT|nr:DUF4402 domain-containing protein [Denitrobaculum tricleocarpae]TQV74409.1 DUF4402 domain-containing protein [Denitrobaculum tricleocarpae]